MLAVDIDASPQRVWEAVTDWPAQSQWMLGTVVRATTPGAGGGPGQGVGGGLEAWTGLGGFGQGLGFLDTMVVTVWDPPRRCVVRHTGRLVRGVGYFVVAPLPGRPERSRFVWAEQFDLPLGGLGRIGWPLLRPMLAAGVRTSLRRLARSMEAVYPTTLTSS